MHGLLLGSDAPPLAYKRLILKLSGDILKGKEQSGIDFNKVGAVAKEIAEVHNSGLEIGIVIGGGNLFRGAEIAKFGYDRVIADNMGMLSTIINALAVQNAIENLGIDTRVMTAIRIVELAEPFIQRRAIRHLQKRRVVIFAAGTGNPMFTTDSAAALRASQIGAEVILKGTKVDGVYDKDPFVYPEAIKFEQLDYMRAINLDVGVMDMTAITFCKDNKIPIIVFDLNSPGNLRRVVAGEEVGTLVREVKQ